MVKQRLKHTAAALAGWAGIWSAFERAHRSAWTIVCYHRVLPAAAKASYFCPDLVVTPEALRAHCAVYRKRFDVLTVAEGLRRWRAGGAGGRPVLSISFDDGYQDNALFAAPILADAGLAASFYVIAGLADTADIPWYDRVALAVQREHAEPLSREPTLSATFAAHAAAPPATVSRAVVEALKRLPDAERRRIVAALPDEPPAEAHDQIMDAAQLQSLRAMGHEIGAHSFSHPILPKVAPEALELELAGARARLESLSAGAVETFCYPNGDFTPQIAAETRRAGYNCALSTRQGLNRHGADPAQLARVFINESWFAAPDGVASQAMLRAELALLHRFRR